MGVKSVVVFNKVVPKDLLPFKGEVLVDDDFLNKVEKYDTILVYDSPLYLPFWTQKLEERGYVFRYHIVLFFRNGVSGYLLRSHVGLGLYCRDKTYRDIKAFRIPHKYCKFCGDTLKDWGGKKHLMNPQGALVSDVWKHLDIKNEDVFNAQLSPFILNEITKMVNEVEVIEGVRGVLRFDGEDGDVGGMCVSLDGFVDKVVCGDALDFLKSLPDNSVDMVFADPPYNLGKPYKGVSDNRGDYINWCVSWIREAVRVVKGGGSVFILNTPKNTHHIYPFIAKDF